MKSIFTTLLVAVFSCVSIFAQEEFTVSSAEITFNFDSKNVDGSISGFESESKIDFSNITQSKFKGSVMVETIKTGNFLRDWHLKGNKYFNVDKHPKIAFESTQIVKNKNGLTVNGNLTLKGTVKPITINFTQDQLQLVGTTTLFSSDYGIAIKQDRADNKVKVTIILQLKK